jgi:hypothetical protein
MFLIDDLKNLMLSDREVLGFMSITAGRNQ